jgi:iron complex transport system substrate-binding protein
VRNLPKVTKTLIPVSASSVEIDRLVRDRLRNQTALYSLDKEALEALEPDLIVTQTLCDVCAVSADEVQSAACTLPGSPKVINLEPERLSEIYGAIRQVAECTGTQRRAEQLIEELMLRVHSVVERSNQIQLKPRVALLEWLDPPFSCGHWNPELVRLAGGIEVLGKEGQRSRTLTWSEVIESQPEVVLISCCGFTVERTLEDIPSLQEVEAWKKIPAVQSGRVFVTDGSQYFSRPGPRLIDSLEILSHIMLPDSTPLPDGAPLVVLHAHEESNLQ